MPVVSCLRTSPSGLTKRVPARPLLPAPSRRCHRLPIESDIDVSPLRIESGSRTTLRSGASRSQWTTYSASAIGLAYLAGGRISSTLVGKWKMAVSTRFPGDSSTLLSALTNGVAHRCHSALRRTKRCFFAPPGVDGPPLPLPAAARRRSSVLRAAAADAAMSNGMLLDLDRPAGGVAYGE